MALVKQNVPISFEQGIDTKTDPKQILIGKLFILENMIFISPKRLKKRNGFMSLPSSINGTANSITAGASLSTFKDEVIETDGTTVYSFGDETQGWTSKGNQYNVAVNAAPVVRNTYQQTSQDSCFHPYGLYTFVWEDSSGGSRYSVIDQTTGQHIVSNVLISATASIPKCYTLGTQVIIIFFDSSNSRIRYKTFPAVNPTAITSAVDLTTDNNTTPVFDAIVTNNRFFLTYNNNTAGINILYLIPILLTPVTLTVAGDAAQTISLFSDTSNNVWVIYYNGTSVKVFIVDFDLVSVLTTTVIETIANVQRVTGDYNGTLGQLFYDVSGTPNSNFFTKINTLTVSGTVGTPSVLCRSIGIASKSFFYNNMSLIILAFDSPLQPTYFLLNNSGVVLAKISPDLGGGIPSKRIVPNVNEVSTGVFEISYLQKDFVTTQTGGQVYFQLGVMFSVLDFTEQATQKIELGNNLQLTGGQLSMYDGATTVEQNFVIYPEQVTNTVQNIDGALSPKQYQYAVTYEWTDNYGQIHRSTPSVPLTVDLNPNTAQTAFNFTADTNSSQTLTNVSSIASITIGAIITGTDIPLNTYVIGIISSNSILISQNATGTTASVIMTLRPNFSFLASTKNGSVTMTPGDMQYLNLIGTWTSGSSTITVTDTSGLVGFSGPVGQGQRFDTNSGDFPNNTIINSISGKTLTLSQPASTTKTNTVAVITQRFTGDTMIGSPDITNVNASFITTFLSPGQHVAIAGVYPANILRIVSLGTNTVTVNVNFGATTVGVIFDAFINASAQLVVGETITDTNAGATLFTDTTIETIASNIITLSQPATATQTSATFNTNTVFAVTLTIPTLRVTSKTGVLIKVYRTEGDGTLFYLVSSITSPTFNDKTVDSVTFYDGTGDTQIIGNEQLYTNGGELGNIAPPVSKSISSYKNRVILIPSESPNQFYYSKQVIPGSPVEFTAEFVQNIDQKGGDLTVSLQMDDKLILFKNQNIFYMVGEGPSPNGANNDFSSPQLIATDVGCTEIASPVLMPLGIMFKSEKGIYLLDRSLNAQYIGADVEIYNSDTVTSAKLIGPTNQVRFTLDSGICLVYDYFKLQWSVFTNVNAVDATIFQDKHTYLQSNGLVKQETPGQFSDDGEFIRWKIVTSWLSFVGIQGFQRVWRMLVLGEYNTPHKLLVSFAHDFNPYITQEEIIDAGAAFPSDLYGSVSPYGADPVYGGLFPLYQWRVRLNEQKTETVQVTLQDAQEPDFGESASISAISFEIGLKKGLFKKLGPGNTFG